MNEYIRQIYEQRLNEAEAASQRLRDIQSGIIEKWRKMTREGRLYRRAERDADSAALSHAEMEFTHMLERVYEIEDAEKAGH